MAIDSYLLCMLKIWFAVCYATFINVHTRASVGVVHMLRLKSNIVSVKCLAFHTLFVFSVAKCVCLWHCMFPSTS